MVVDRIDNLLAADEDSPFNTVFILLTNLLILFSFSAGTAAGVAGVAGPAFAGVLMIAGLNDGSAKVLLKSTVIASPVVVVVVGLPASFVSFFPP